MSVGGRWAYRLFEFWLSRRGVEGVRRSAGGLRVLGVSEIEAIGCRIEGLVSPDSKA